MMIFLVNVNKFARKCGFPQIYERNPLRKTSFFVQFHAPYDLSHLPDKVNTFRFQHNIQKLLTDRY